MKKILALIGFALLAGCSSNPPERYNIITGTAQNPVVIPPVNCPDWSKYSAADWNNTLGSNYGCATVTNFGAQVADPNDLIAGKASDLYNGARTSVSVGQYEAGPPVNSTLPTAASASGASQ